MLICSFRPAWQQRLVVKNGGPGEQDAGAKLPPLAFLASGSRDKTIRVWDVSSGQCIKILVGLILISRPIPVLRGAAPA